MGGTEMSKQNLTKMACHYGKILHHCAIQNWLNGNFVSLT